MKTIFVEARSNKQVGLPGALIKKLPEKTALFMTVQYLDSQDKVAASLREKGINPILEKPAHAKYNGQVLGCSIERFDCDAILYIGDGLFHPIALSIENDVPVYTYNPRSKRHGVITEELKKKYLQKRKAGLAKYYMSKNIGILVSTKPGQLMLKQALEFKKKCQKNCFILISDNIDFQGLENFPFIESYVNTACPRISYDDYRRIGKPIVSIYDIRPEE